VTFTVHNSFSKEKEPFHTLEEGLVRMYNCGPTVYNRQHIGNFRAFLFADTLRRWLEYLGYTVQQVMNITDVGHIVADEDQGEDKLEAQARREKTDPWQISRTNTETFLADLRDLGVRPAGVYPRATDHIPEMLEMIDGLVKSGHAYESEGNVYFDVSRFEPYGKLSGNKVSELEAGARIAVRDDKRNAEDFALWKIDPKHVMKWASHYGEHGFPGWHIECSAMARKHLGDQIDIHTGGEDNIFPHHECEIAQSEAFTGKQFARYWMHTRFLKVDGGKMAKSLGNTYSLDDVRERGFEVRVLRYALIRGHYRESLNFTWDIMDQCKSALDNLDDLARRLSRAADGEASSESGAIAEAQAALDACRGKFEDGMNDDLNTPTALAALHELRGAWLQGEWGSEAARAALEFLHRADEVLGVIRWEEAAEGDAEIQSLVDARDQARADKNWAEADRLRDELQALGIVTEDGADGTVWFRK